MDPKDFIGQIAQAVFDMMQKAPPKPVTVIRADQKIQTTSLAQLMQNMSDQLIISNNIEREQLIAIKEHTIALRENTELGKKQLRRAKRRRDDDDDEDGG